MPGAPQAETVAWRVVEGLGQFQGVFGDLAIGAALRVGRHGDVAFAVGVLDAGGALAHGDGGDLVQRDHLVGAGHGNGQAFDVFFAHPVIGVQAHGHITGLAGRVYPVAHFDPGKRDSQGLRRVIGRNTQGVGQAAVEFDLQLLLGVLLGQSHIDRPGNQAQLVHVGAGDFQQLARIRPGEVDLNRFARAVVQVVHHHVFSTHQGAHLLPQLDGNRLGAALAGVALANVNVNTPAIGRDVAVGVFGLGEGAGEFGSALHLEARVLDGGGGGRAHLNHQVARVCRGQKAGAAPLELQSDGSRQTEHGDGGHPAAVVQGPGNHVPIAVRLVVKPHIEARQHRTQPFFGRRVVVHGVAPVSRQHGVQGKGDAQAHQHRASHGQGKGPEPLARDTWHERHRNEHRNDGKRGGCHRHADFGRALQRGRSAIRATLHVAHDVFAHHNRIVNQHADGQREPQQGHEIEGEAAQPHGNEGRNDRGG